VIFITGDHKYFLSLDDCAGVRKELFRVTEGRELKFNALDD